MEEDRYPWREALASCGVMVCSAGLFITLIGILAVLAIPAIFWN